MAQSNPVAALRARLAPHGYHLFLQPDRPSGWLVVLKRRGDGLGPPLEARAPSREEALVLAERFFITHRVQELDAAIRERRLTPPGWTEATQGARLDVLSRYAQSHCIDV